MIGRGENNTDLDLKPGQPVCPVIAGPTASGKTSLVTQLSAKFPIEVISLDSCQIYRGLRIGTAQPTAEELAVCPHHLVDFIPPDQKYNATRFRQDFERVYQEVVVRGAKPILAGGAGLYLTAVRDGFLKIPGADNEERLAEVRAELDKFRDEEIRDLLAKVDPGSFARIHVNDRYRSQRAVEIFKLAGESMTDLTAKQVSDPVLGICFPTFILSRPVDQLDARIALRTEQMLNEGWIEETKQALVDYEAGCPGLSCIGYKEIVAHLDGRLTREELVPAIIRVTRQYAKRQRTWFRHVPQVWSGSPDSSELVDQIGSCFLP